MPKIGIILAGAASKGAYEQGCLRAIEEHFGAESIKFISSASIGMLVAQSYAIGRPDVFESIWKSIDPKKHGRFFLTFSGNGSILERITDALCEDYKHPIEHYVSVWNFTQKKVEYIPFHELTKEQTAQYIRGGVAIPLFSKGELVNGDRILDGAFLDNIPAYPLVDKDIDYVFCIYFDNCKYYFENDEFNKKIVKLYDFPNEKMLELMTFDPEGYDRMEQYGYDYTKREIESIFTSEDKEEVYNAIKKRENTQKATYTPRLTADIVLNNINVVTKKYSHRLTNRKKTKQND